MNLFARAAAAAALFTAPLVLPLQPAGAGVGDLLVAPTRIVLNGGRSAEIILNNIGEEPATYRISAEFRRMKPDGTLEEVSQANTAEEAARDMVIFAPRRVTLAPREPQSVRIAARVRRAAFPTANTGSICCSGPFRPPTPSPSRQARRPRDSASS